MKRLLGIISWTTVALFTAAFMISGLPVTAHAIGNVWVTDTDNNRVVKLDPNGNELFSVGGFDNPTAVAVNPTDGTVWIGDRGLNQLMKFDSDGNELLRLDGVFSSSSPSAVAVNPVEGTVWASNYSRYGVVKFDLDGNVILDVSFKFLYILQSGMSVNTADGSVWIASEDFNNIGSYAVLKLQSDGTELARIGGFSDRPSVSVNPTDGSAWIADGYDEIIKVDSAGNELFRVGGFYVPVDLSVDPTDGSVWVADNYNHRVARIDADGNIVASAWSGNPVSIAVDPVDGSVWVADLVTVVRGILKIAADGTELLRITELGGVRDIAIESIVNGPPVLEPLGSFLVYEGNEVSFYLRATDPDGDLVSFNAVGLPPGATFDENHGAFFWIPNHSQEGLYEVTFIATDGYFEDSDTTTITVLDGEGPPINKKRVIRKKASEEGGKQVASYIKEELDSTFDVKVSFANLEPKNADVTVTTFETCPKSPAGFQVGDMCFDMTANAISFDYVEICVIYDETAVKSEKELMFMHYEDKKWINITTRLDMDVNVICGKSKSLSPFAVFEREYTFIGFLAPLENPPTDNTAKAGRTIPVKWQLPRTDGNYISDLSAVTDIGLQETQCGGMSENPVYETDTSGSSGLRYDVETNQFVYTWKTEKGMEGCYSLILELYGFDRHEAYFELK